MKTAKKTTEKILVIIYQLKIWPVRIGWRQELKNMVWAGVSFFWVIPVPIKLENRLLNGLRIPL